VDVSAQSMGGVAPRVRLQVSARELMLALGVLGIGIFITGSWLRDPNGHTVRRLATGIAALAVGVAALYLSFRRSCSACRRTLLRFSLRTTVFRMRAIELCLAGGDWAGAARLLRDAAGTALDGGSTSQGTPVGASCSLLYCGGCRGLLLVEVAEDGGERRTELVTGARATALVPVVEAVARGAEAAG
jgi:hypothetical protein